MTGTDLSKTSYFSSVFVRSTLIVFLCMLFVASMLTLTGAIGPEQISSAQSNAASTTAVVSAVLLIAVGWLFRRMTTTPLQRLSSAVQAALEGDFTPEIKEKRRKDEIGMLARAVSRLRDSLTVSVEQTRRANVNSIALDTSSTAVILTGADRRITYANKAAEQLLRKHEAAIRAIHRAFSVETLIGYSADQILATTLPRSATGTTRQGQQMDSGYLAVNISPLCDENGQMIGQILEWHDMTIDRRNAAVIEAINNNQLRIDLTTDARIDVINTAFADLLGNTPEALHGVSMSGKILHNGIPICQLMIERQPITGRFVLLLDGQEHQLEGAANPILNDEGKLTHFCLLASDVTMQQATLAKLDIEQKAMEEAQLRVVEALRAALEKLSDGNLASPIEQEFPQSYETLRLDYNTATTNLLLAIKQVLDNAHSIRNEAGQLAAAADDMSRRTEQQAATLEQTAAALNQLTAAVQSAADGAARANKMVSDAKSHAETSGNIVREAVTAMGEIEESSNKISKITSVIDEIAFQTNLLALNAGVEAARAGEAGRGFAVVASEVRALAQRSSDAAREIAGLISSSSNQVRRGVDLVGQAGDALGSIQISVTDIFSVVSDIAVSTREQSTGLNEINSAVHQLDQVTQQNAAMFEQSTAASQSLSREANSLISTMDRFSLGDASPEETTIASFRSYRDAGPTHATSAPAARQSGSLALKPDVTEDEWEDF